MPIYCINLSHREDRKKHSLEQFKKIGIPEYQIIYPPFTKDNRGGFYGCFDSHMKIWNDFYLYYPNQSYALIFEDDFIAPPHADMLIKMAAKFTQENDVDIVNFHNLCVPLEGEQNNKLFTHGYGLGTHAYLITRRYIESIIERFGSLPMANGRHIDYEISINNIDKDNRLYSEKIFYTHQEAFTQMVGKSDNMISFIGKIHHGIFGERDSDRTTHMNYTFSTIRFLKKNNLISDENVKWLTWSLNTMFVR